MKSFQFSDEQIINSQIQWILKIERDIYITLFVDEKTHGL